MLKINQFKHFDLINILQVQLSTSNALDLMMALVRICLCIVNSELHNSNCI